MDFLITGCYTNKLFQALICCALFFSFPISWADDLEAGFQALQQADYEQALALFEKEAARGNRFACYNLGVMYLEGIGVGEDLVAAYVWFQKAARKGDTLAAQSARIVLQRMTPAQLMDARHRLNPSPPQEP